LAYIINSNGSLSNSAGTTSRTLAARDPRIDPIKQPRNIPVIFTMRVGNWGLIVARYRKNILVYDDLQDCSSWSNGLDASIAVPVATAPVGSFALIMGIYE
jgi:hypothetical protein